MVLRLRCVAAHLTRCSSTAASSAEQPRKKQEFRVFRIPGLTKFRQQTDDAKEERMRMHQLRRDLDTPAPPRSQRLKPDGDWTAMWPTARSYNWSVVPLPMRQGIVNNLAENGGVSPGGYANMELMKIPNFLHLTPRHIKQQCAQLKQFCTPWPEQLTEEAVARLMPVRVTKTSFIQSHSSVRDWRARKVRLSVPLSALQLDHHAREKFLKLAERWLIHVSFIILRPCSYSTVPRGARIAEVSYNPSREMVEVVADCCPLSRQNYDHAQYILAAMYHESWRVEAWEHNKTRSDNEKFYWNLSDSRQTVVRLASEVAVVKGSYLGLSEITDESVIQLEPVKQLARAQERLHEAEDDRNVKNYRDAALQVLSVPPLPDSS